MNASQVRAKARMAMKKREEEIEQEEVEGGELNLVPYLDIVTNVMLFLLASITSGLILGNINSALPEYSVGETTSGGGDTDEPPLGLVLAVTDKDIQLFGMGIDAEQPGGLNKPFVKILAKAAPAGKPDEIFDYAALNAAATKIVQDRYQGLFPVSLAKDAATGEEKPVCVDGQKNELTEDKCRPQGATEVILLIDQTVPYHVVVNVMDALRNNTEVKDGVEVHKYPDNLLFPECIFATGIR